jgi:hypothetical protein
MRPALQKLGGREGGQTVESIGPYELIHLPSAVATCAACGSHLFAVIAAFFDQDGEPIESEIYCGCVVCDEEIGTSMLAGIRKWVHAKYRVMR